MGGGNSSSSVNSSSCSNSNNNVQNANTGTSLNITSLQRNRIDVKEIKNNYPRERGDSIESSSNNNTGTNSRKLNNRGISNN